ncbi:MAG: type II toxin-antitoxin system HicB family antitoxin [Gemmataceae bacterium]
MTNLPYSLIIEATADPAFFGFYSEELEGFSGVGSAVEDRLNQAGEAMREHREVLEEQRLPVPPTNPDPVIVIRNERRDTTVWPAICPPLPAPVPVTRVPPGRLVH